MNLAVAALALFVLKPMRRRITKHGLTGRRDLRRLEGWAAGVPVDMCRRSGIMYASHEFEVFP